MKKPLRLVRLSPSDPHSALRRPARKMPARRAEPLRLTEKQLKNPLIRSAYARLCNIVDYRGRYLRRLDRVNGDRRTRVEVFRTLACATEQMLVRLDLATGVLGYFDMEDGQFVLNTQLGIAEDADISPAVLNRMFKLLDEAGYVYRRIERIRLDETDENGLHLVRTRVLVRFTKLFWNDLGLRYVYERAQKAAKKRRAVQLRELGQRKLAEIERKSLEQLRSEASRSRWQAKMGAQVDGEKVSTRAEPSRSRGASAEAVSHALDRLLAKVNNAASG